MDEDACIASSESPDAVRKLIRSERGKRHQAEAARRTAEAEAAALRRLVKELGISPTEPSSASMAERK